MNKKLLSAVIGVLALTFVVAAVFIANINATATISESISTATTDVSYSGYPGETICVGVPITNAASVANDVELTYAAGANPNNVTYTTNMDGILAQTLAPGANNVNTCVTYNGSSPVGDIAGVITINRV